MKRINVLLCAAKNCYNSRVTHPGKGFFQFPTNLSLCQLWLNNCGRDDLDFNHVSKGRGTYKLCADHFEDKWFTDANKMWLVTEKHPVPTLFSDHKVKDVPAAEINLTSDGPPGIDVTNNRCPTPEELHAEVEDLCSYNSTEFLESKDFESNSVIKCLLNQNEESEYYHINSLCRFCMCPVTDDYIEIFSKSVEATEIRAMCKVVLPNKVKIGDGRPTKICRPCTIKLRACRIFFEQFLNAEQYYKTIIRYSLFIEDEGSYTDECDELPPGKEIPENSLVIPLNNYSSDIKGIQHNRQKLNNVNSKTFNDKETSGVKITVTDKTLEQNDIEVICSNVVLLAEEDKRLVTPSTTECQNHEELGKNCQIGVEENAITNFVKLTENYSSVSVRFKCLECLKLFSSYSCLVNHIKEGHYLKTSTLLDECNDFHSEFEKSTLLPVQRSTDVVNAKLDSSCNINAGITYTTLECLHCNIQFDKNIEFKQHLKKFHSLKCSHCGTLFYDKDKLEKHILRKHDHNTKCYVCDKEFKTAAIRKKHETSHEKNYVEMCWICGTILKTKVTFQRHMKMHDNKEFRCEICNKVYKTKLTLTVHKKNIHRPTIETKEKSFTCKFCPNRFYHAESLRQHIRMHETKKTITCEYCNRVFINRCVYNRHKKRRLIKGSCPSRVANNRHNNSHECDICKRVFVKRINLKKHRKYHFCEGDPEVIQQLLTEPELQKCDICGKSCFSKIMLHYHKKVSHSIKLQPFKCSFCDKSVLSHNQLVIHERIHTGELPYTCRYCKKGFRDARTLESHEMCHTEEKPHVCQICSKGFKTHRRLIVHTQIHKDATHLRPYVCNICTRRFVNNRCLVAHMNRFHTPENKQVTAVKKYPCEECGKIYATMYGYQKHKKKSHQVTQVTGVTNGNGDNVNQVSLEYVTVQDSETIYFEPTEVGEHGINDVNKKSGPVEYLQVIQNDKNISDLGLQGLAYIVAPVDPLNGLSTFWNVSESQGKADQ